MGNDAYLIYGTYIYILCVTNHKYLSLKLNMFMMYVAT